MCYVYTYVSTYLRMCVRGAGDLASATGVTYELGARAYTAAAAACVASKRRYTYMPTCNEQRLRLLRNLDCGREKKGKETTPVSRVYTCVHVYTYV